MPEAQKVGTEAGQSLESGDPGYRDRGCPCSHSRGASVDTVCKAAFTDSMATLATVEGEASRPRQAPLGIEGMLLG